MRVTITIGEQIRRQDRTSRRESTVSRLNGSCSIPNVTLETMAHQYPHGTNLASILDALSAGNSHPQQLPANQLLVSRLNIQAAPTPPLPPVRPSSAVSDDVSQLLNTLLQQRPQQVAQSTSQHHTVQQRREPAKPVTPPPSQTDATAIVDWSTGLRHVISLTASDPHFATRIQKVVVYSLIASLYRNAHLSVVSERAAKA